MVQFKVSIDKKYEEYFEQFKVENAKLKKYVESLEKQLTMAIAGYVRVPRKLGSLSLPRD